MLSRFTTTLDEYETFVRYAADILYIYFLKEYQKICVEKIA